MGECRRHALQPALLGRVGRETRDGCRQQQQRGGEDRRNDAGGVQLERQVGVVAAELPVADLALRVVDRDAPLRPLDEDDQGDDQQRDQQEQDDEDGRERAGPAEFEGRDQGARQVGDDAREDDQRDAVADAAGGDLLAQPHQEHGAADQRDDAGDAEEPAGIGDRRAEAAAHAFEPDGDAPGLEDRDQHGQVAGILVELLPPRLAFLLQGLERGDGGGHQLHDDAGRDVGHDVQREHGHPAERAAGEHVEHAEDAAAMLGQHLAHHRGIDAGDRHIGAEAVDDQRTEGEPDALLELGGLREDTEIEIGRELFGGGGHACPILGTTMAPRPGGRPLPWRRRPVIPLRYPPPRRAASITPRPEPRPAGSAR